MFLLLLFFLKPESGIRGTSVLGTSKTSDGPGDVDRTTDSVSSERQS